MESKDLDCLIVSGGGAAFDRCWSNIRGAEDGAELQIRHQLHGQHGDLDLLFGEPECLRHQFAGNGDVDPVQISNDTDEEYEG